MSYFDISKSKMVFASLANLIYFIISSLSYFLIVPFTYKALGQEVYGVWIIMMSIVQMAGLVNLGVGYSVSRFIAQYSASEENNDLISASVSFGYTSIIITSVIACIGLALLSGPISYHLNAITIDISILQSTIKIVSVSLLPFSVGLVSKDILLGLVKNKITGGIDFIHFTALWLGALYIGKIGGGLITLGWWFLLLNTFYFISLTYFMVKGMRGFRLHFYWNKKISWEVFKFSIFTWISSLGVVMYNTTDRFLVGVLVNPSAAGAYGIATSVSQRFNMVANQLAQTLCPYSSNQQALGKSKEVVFTFRQVTRLIAWFMAICAIILIAWTDVILNIWISPEFSKKYTDLFRILLAAYAIFSMARPAIQVLLGIGNARAPGVISFLSGAGMILGVWFFSQRFGLLGAIYANFIISFLLANHIYLSIIFGKNPIRLFIEDLFIPISFILVNLIIPYSMMDDQMKLLFSASLLLISILLALLFNRNIVSTLWMKIQNRLKLTLVEYSRRAGS